MENKIPFSAEDFKRILGSQEGRKLLSLLRHLAEKGMTLLSSSSLSVFYVGADIERVVNPDPANA